MERTQVLELMKYAEALRNAQRAYDEVMGNARKHGDDCLQELRCTLRLILNGPDFHASDMRVQFLTLQRLRPLTLPYIVWQLFRFRTISLVKGLKSELRINRFARRSAISVFSRNGVASRIAGLLYSSPNDLGEPGNNLATFADPGQEIVV